jgi:hypothetical protein
MKYRTHEEITRAERSAVSSIPADARAEDRARRAAKRLKGKKAWKQAAADLS